MKCIDILNDMETGEINRLELDQVASRLDIDGSDMDDGELYSHCWQSVTCDETKEKDKMMTTENRAYDWVNTDAAACRKDVERLGLEGAVEYQLDLIEDRKATGDDRWDSITDEQMREALVEVTK